MSISKLPAVVSFHLKRFEHDARAAKISTSVQFPETLDMQPYLSHFVRSQVDSGAGSAADAKSAASALDDDTYNYKLFAVVNHYGTLQNGHYTTFVRQIGADGQW